MQMTIDLKDLLLIILIGAAIVLVIYLIVMVSNLTQTLKKLNTVLDDSKRITKVAAEKTETLDGVIDETADMMLGVVDTVRGNTSIIDKMSNIGSGLASARSIANKLRTDEEKEHAARAKARRTKNASKNTKKK